MKNVVELRHVWLYVNNLETMTEFYKHVFNMLIVCENLEQSDALVKDILKIENSTIRISKLITERGKVSGVGDMLELIEVIIPCEDNIKNLRDIVFYRTSTMHICFGVNNIEKIIREVIRYGGKACTDIHIFSNGNKCCFCQDVEGNWIELIERT